MEDLNVSAVDDLIHTTPSRNLVAALAISNLTLSTSLPSGIVGKITEQVKTVKLNREDAQHVVNRYEGACDGLGEIIDQIRGIVVLESNQKEAMAEAHRLRMILVKRRGIIDDIRKEAKAEAKNRIDFVDGMGRGIRLALEEVETYAQFQEDFAKREKAAKRQELLELRQQALQPFLAPNILVPVGLADMTDEAFKTVLESAIELHHNRIAEDRKVELVKYGHTELVEGLGRMTPETWELFLNAAKATHEENQREAVRRQEKIKERTRQLSNIGLNYDYMTRGYKYDELIVTDADVSSLDDVAFSSLIGTYSQTVKAREGAKAERLAAKQATEQRWSDRQARVSAIGMVYNSVSGYVYDELAVTGNDIEYLPDADFDAKLSDLSAEIARRVETKRAESEAAENARLESQRLANELVEENRRKAAEAARLKTAPDREKFKSYFKGVHDAIANRWEYETPEARYLSERFFDEAASLVNKYAAEADKLGDGECPF